MEAVRPFLVYRDLIGSPSEIGFLRRQYIGFTRLRPVWVGRTIRPEAAQLGYDVCRLGGDGPLGGLRRLLFRYGGYVPRSGLPWSPNTPPSRSGLTARSPSPAARDGQVRPGEDGEHADRGGIAPVIHAQFARGGALALPLARSRGAGLVVTLHGGDVSKQKNWRRTVLAARWPDLVREAARFICVSQAVAEIGSARGVPAGKLTVLPIGTEVPEAPPARHPAHYLFVGRFVEKKGIAVLTQAVRRLRAAGDITPLVCVGEGPMGSALATLANEVSGIELAGWLPPSEVTVRMRQAVALIVPSIIAADGDAEGLPSVIPEAMAQGCPVIASAQGGMAEAIADGVTGLLTAPNDAIALARAMEHLSCDRMLAERLGLAGFRHAMETLNAHRQSAKLEALLLSVAAQQQKAGR